MSAAKLITAKLLTSLSVREATAKKWAKPLESACEEHGINTPVRVSLFLANILHESLRLQHLEENLWYSTPERVLAIFPSKVTGIEHAKSLVKNPTALACCVYAGRLGNVAPMDGYKYRGRSPIQLTGLANYAAAGEALGLPLVADPDQLLLPTPGSRVSAWFWKSNGLNELADQRQFSAVTKKINGPMMLGHKERMVIYEDVQHFLGMASK